MNFYECMVDRLENCGDVDAATANYLSIASELAQKSPIQVAVEYTTALVCALHGHIAAHDCGASLAGEYFQAKNLLEDLLCQMTEDVDNEQLFSMVIDQAGLYGPIVGTENETDDDPTTMWVTYPYEEVFTGD